MMEERYRQSSDASAGSTLTDTIEVVLLRSGQAAGRHTLASPLTLIGAGQDCEIRIDENGIAPRLAVIAMTAGGVFFRSLSDDCPMRVNSKPATDCKLGDGDEIVFGETNLRMVISHSEQRGQDHGTAAALEAVRFEAVAVAARQTALAAEEHQLEMQRSELAEQRRQLSRHLNERRRLLVKLRDQAVAARTQLLAERSAYEDRVAEVFASLASTRQELALISRDVLRDRERVARLRRKLKQRWHRHWQRERIQARAHEAELAAQAQILLAEQRILQQERERHTTNVAIGRRQFAEMRAQLAREQERLQQAETDLRQKAAGLAKFEQELACAQEAWSSCRTQRLREMDGLEVRIRNLRNVLVEQQNRLSAGAGMPEKAGNLESPQLVVAGQEHAISFAAASLQLLSSARDSTGECSTSWPPVETFDAMAADLADQRLLLAEECDRVLAVIEHWQTEREEHLQQCAAICKQIEHRENNVRSRELMLARVEAGWNERSMELERARRHLDALRARVAAEAGVWHLEKEQLLADAAHRVQLAECRLHYAEQIRSTWKERRQQLFRWLGQLRNDLRDAQSRAKQLQTALAHNRVEHLKAQRRVEEKALALEQHRRELLSKSQDSATAEKHLQRLQNRWAAVCEAEQQVIAGERQKLLEISRGQDERNDQIAAAIEQLACLQADLGARETALAQQTANDRLQIDDLQLRLNSLQALRRYHEELVQSLRDEVERLVLIIMEGNEEHPATLGQAA